jgi:uncharacterized DUF497 family protein
MDFDGFDWDDGNWPKCGKHGVSKEEIEAAFFASRLTLLVDATHGGAELRYLAIARGPPLSRPVFVGFTERQRGDQRLIRPVTARYMHVKEMRRHGIDKA